MSDDLAEKSKPLANGGLNPVQEKMIQEMINSFRGGVRRIRLGEESAQKTNQPYAPLLKSKKGI